jgi:predicted secreted protein
MSVTLGIAIYVILWWTVLFAVLPIGVRTQGEDGAVVPGTPESAPTTPRLVRVVLLTTLISGLLFVAAWAAVKYGLADLAVLLGRE